VKDTARLRQSRPVLKSRVSVVTSDLRPGMFVVELDRPWAGTPFLVQGFLATEPDDIETLRQLCLEVVIDPRRSDAAALTGLLDLYQLPEESAEPEDAEDLVRVRYVQNQPATPRAGFNAAWVDLKRLRETVSKGFMSLTGPASMDGAWRARQKRLRIKPGEVEQQDETVALPRFSKSEIRYAPVDEQPDSMRKPFRKKKPSGIAWEKRSSRMRRAVSSDDVAVTERLARFDRLIESLKPDVGGLLRNLMPSGATLAPLRAVARLRQRGVKRRPVSSDQARDLSIPKYLDLVVYRDRVGIEGEIARARDAMRLSEDTLARLKSDAGREGALRVDGLPGVVDALVASVSRNADAMIWVSRVRLHNSTAYSHSIKVASYLLAFGRHLGFPASELAELAQVGLLMDVELDPQLVNKTETLTDDEFVELQRHVELGLERLERSIALPKSVMEGIAQHHEWIDGSGYPKGLQGEQIGIYGRMAAIADMYAALTTHRPYAPTMSSYDALQLMYARADQQLHGPLVEQFVRAIGLYPVGSLVLLSTEEVAVVTALDKVQRLEPRVLVLTGPDKNTLARPYELDLVKAPKDERGQIVKILRSLPAGVHNIDFRNYYIA
jgi:HD-GYP domain-containing protein (c-di-GMP phosphodiesterase class II)